MVAATEDDVPDLVRVLAAAVPDCSPQTVWAVPWTWPTYRVVRDVDGTPIAAGSTEDLDEHRAELRGLVVDPGFRGLGLASAIVRHLREQLRRRHKAMVCVTQRPEFFRRLGFVDTVPSWIELQPQRRRGNTGGQRRVAMASA